MARDRESVQVDMARILELREQQLREQEEKNARFDQYLWEKQKELDQLKEKQGKGEGNPEQTRALEQKITTMEHKIKTLEQTSQLQHDKVKKRKGE